MAWVILGARLLDRVARWDNLIAASALVLLLASPTQLMEPGFQLSFGAVISLAAFVVPCEQWLSQHLPGKGIFRLLRAVLLIAAATVAVWVGLWPILAWYFHLLNPVSVPANVVLVPLASLLVWAGMCALVAGLAWPPVMAACAPILSFLIDGMIGVVRVCHALPGGWWVVGQPQRIVVAGYYLLLGLTWIGMRAGWKRVRLAQVWLAAAAVLVWLIVFGAWQQRGWLRLDVLDVGHGDAAVIRLPDARVLLLDAGTEQAARTRVVPFLRQQGIGVIDAMILSHPDADHIGGAAHVLEQVRVRRLLTNGAADDTMAFLRLSRVAREQGIEHRTVHAGFRLVAEGVRIEVVHPPAGFVAGTRPESNDNALVLRLQMGEIVWLLTADIEEAGIPVMLAQRPDWRVNLLKAPHHGSRLGQAGEQLFQRVRPDLALISVGKLHSLPAAQTLHALGRAAKSVKLTRDAGCIRVETNGRVMRVSTFK
jgi:competence protein ComEC